MAHADAHEHDDHGHAVADGDDLPHHGPVIEEPRSPMWLPFLGLAVFGVALVWWLSTPNDAEEARAAAEAAASASASATGSVVAPAAEAPPKPEVRPAPRPPGAPNNAPAAVQPAMTVNPAVKLK